MELPLLRKSCEQRAIPLISTQTELLLSNILQQYRPKNCLEIWSAVGYSGIFISSIISKRWWGLTSFEIGYHSYKEALLHTHEAAALSLTLYPFDFTNIEISRLITGDIDFVFVDGQKNQYLDYLMKIEDMVGTKCILVFDDVLKYKSKLSSLYGYLEKKQIIYQIIESEPGDWIMVIHLGW